MATQSKSQQMQAAPQGGAIAPAQDFISYKNLITNAVLHKISELQKGGIQCPAGYSVQNQIYLAFLKLTSMTTRDGKPLLSVVKPQSVANALLTMCIKGLSLEKGQCAFIQYGDEVQFQEEYYGKIALAKRCGAGDPQVQVIYEDDIFEYCINPTTGKKSVIKHEQKLQNIDNAKIIGAWCVVPCGDDSQEPKVEIMTMAEIRQSWMQGATKGQSPAHRIFPQEMAKKTVIGRACKLFYSTSDDAGIYEDADIKEDTTSSGFEVNLANLPAPSADSIPAIDWSEAQKKEEAQPQPTAKPLPVPEPSEPQKGMTPEPSFDEMFPEEN